MSEETVDFAGVPMRLKPFSALGFSLFQLLPCRVLALPLPLLLTGLSVLFCLTAFSVLYFLLLEDVPK